MLRKGKAIFGSINSLHQPPQKTCHVVGQGSSSDQVFRNTLYIVHSSLRQENELDDLLRSRLPETIVSMAGRWKWPLQCDDCLLPRECRSSTALSHQCYIQFFSALSSHGYFQSIYSFCCARDIKSNKKGFHRYVSQKRGVGLGDL